ncbi:MULTISPECIES: 2-oxoglutarate dehydrogenase, E2 component, dihydrolipoamide succinyltransferase [unclassified Rathayibacter]|uniref:2-oxoglutarate dehydrogenase, E2 component, dihydrolipoamide succinyltransferase n=1 Tax=unclassified Rathayibacter TaxID=2609250 RepID=UPI000CE83A9E|nr:MULTISPECIES: 2-oxoglutarate dehydrogenase, E2 component, dihydrolipoamide succinyltransferase [unclassified Rathayibacter]PPI07546.1 2-oxoglutarate dehydrogenase, E2 component, dihydrolipoamide succinyltransferase [Rathayibacter sp. AY1B8]QHC70379.1 2-oxoglutarate dehydrogenase, E2 component, dihydrolipoamide succinyltransferase [Rathayibacter sp. VKM Ac-2801]QHC73664.1 2-oxoglutarate dehydrogenase, E2 component, dihydrolipoamide succinyltransferase [Rathayibacter sp. VKM Ac-2805]QHF20202.1
MSESVSLPALGESVTEGTVTRWLKNVGDRVEVDEPLLEVSTDKVDTEIPSPVAGVIEEILVQEDETVEVGAELVRIGDGSGAASASEPEAPAEEAPEVQAAETEATDEATPSVDAESDAEAPAPAEPEPAPAAEKPAAPEAAAPAPSAPAPAAAAPAPAAAAPAASPEPTDSNPGYVTPLVRKLAGENGIDLSTLTGTGVGGRIRKQDVLDAVEAAKSAPAAPVSAPAAAAAKAARTPLETSPLRGTTQPMSRLRKVLAQRAVESMQTSAQLTSVIEVDVTAVARFRDSVKKSFQEKTGAKLSFLPFFALAAAEALKAYPVINSTLDGESIVYPDHENISIAVDTERGLLTPVLKNASELNLAQIASTIGDLAERTRNNKLKPDELAGGTFTLTNTGSRGALFDTPVVFLPQTAILGTGIVTKKPAVVQVDGADAIAIRSTVFLALSYDHRTVDGADAARFLVAIKERLEEGSFENDLGI